MDASTENDISMIMTVQSMLNDNLAEITTEIPAAVALVTELDTRVVQINAQAILATEDTTGVAEAKAQAATDLVAKTFQVGNAAASYYTITVPDTKLKRILDWNKSELEKMRDTELYVAGQKTWQLCDPIKANLVPWGCPVLVTNNLKLSYEFYFTLIQAPQVAAGDLSAALAELKRKVKATKQWLTDIMDQTFSTIQFSNTELYETYFLARQIVDAPGGTGGGFSAAGVVNQSTVLNIPLTGVSVSDTTDVTLGNTTGVAGLTLQYYFCTTPAGVIEAGVTAASVVSGASQTVQAQTMGRSATRIYLNVRNANASNAQNYLVEIG